MIIHDVEQGTPEWLELRKGRVTASHATAIATNGKGLDTYVLELMSEYYSSGEREYYSNADMDRGNELEELAASAYEMEVGAKLEKVGFVEYNEFVGCSPDRLVGEDGLVEIKCPNDKNFFKFLLEGEKAISTDYMAQMQMQMLVTGRKWCAFVAYNPNFEKSIFIHRVVVDEVKHAKLLEGFKSAEEKIKTIKNQLTK